MPDLSKWGSRKLAMSLFVIVLTTILLVADKLTGDQWIVVCLPVIGGFLGLQTYLDKK